MTKDNDPPPSNPGENELESSTNRDEDRFNTLAVGYGAGFGIVIGSVVFAITQSPIWIGIGIPLGAALGIVLDEWLQHNRH